jgi:membrane-associated phospholipid phosphatase
MNTRRIIANVPGSPRLWLMLFAASLFAYFFFEIVDDVFSDPLEGDNETPEFDAAVAQFFMQFRSERVTQIATDLTALGSVSVLVVFAVLAYAVIIGTRDVIGFLHLSIALLGALVWPVLLKPYFGRDRPAPVDQLVTVADLSFPSGHAFGAAAAYATFAFFCARFLQARSAEIFCYLFVLLLVCVVGITRIYLGVHYASDVLAGVTAGGAWAFFIAAAFSFFYKK